MQTIMTKYLGPTDHQGHDLKQRTWGLIPQ